MGNLIVSRLSWLFILLFSAGPLLARERAGELKIAVSDPSGAALAARGEIASDANRFALPFETGPTGEYAVKKLPFGSYRVTLERDGFASFTTLVEIRSEIPVLLPVSLTLASQLESITVKDSGTLLDTTNTGTSYTLGTLALENRESSTPGRSAIDVVQAQPGWLLEANGVLHPRGSEYGTEYVVDGIPVLENRSPAFAPGEDLNDVQSVKVYTSGIPAEFGRKLGGVVETVSNRNPGRGFHGTALLGGGSLGAEGGSVGGSYFDGRNIFGFSASGAHTDRYLDAPVEQNYTNKATMSGVRGSFERDLTQRDRLRVVVSHDQVGFLVGSRKAGWPEMRRIGFPAAPAPPQRTGVPDV
jgi:hypothetical protein